MRHVMRQNRDGEIVVIDLRPGEVLSGADMLRSWRWTTALLWFMRVMSYVWLAKGFLNWAVLIGAAPRLGVLSAMAPATQATTVFLAVAEVVAAVGLWVASPWGGVIWLATAMVEMSALTLGFAANGNRALTGGIDLVLALAYFTLLWRAGSERG